MGNYDDVEHLGAAIRRRRGPDTLATAAAAIGVRGGTVSRWENGLEEPRTAEAIAGIIEYLGLDSAEFDRLAARTKIYVALRRAEVAGRPLSRKRTQLLEAFLRARPPGGGTPG